MTKPEQGATPRHRFESYMNTSSCRHCGQSKSEPQHQTPQVPPYPRVKLIPMKESWTCPSDQCGIQNVVFAYERANGDQPSYDNCTNCGVKVELGIPRRDEAAALTETEAK